ncbi:protein phosphatase 2C domain-containing protein [Phycicoccus flavus]|uniref:protein phosphatase 2C domain-containing protein n=1 Tax=Phycicoccus flavus TaxID=2502783 RepID=UPI00197C1122|nr:protein phosphatase 2C domain-containing protein [Phycicoccus flavus]
MSTDTATACPTCGAAVTPGARFCEGCGAPLAGTDPSAPVPRHEPDEAGPISRPTNRQRVTAPEPAVRPCAACGGEVGPDLYCTTCGTKAPSPRDHYRESPAPWVAGVCDRGVRHTRNEDAMALFADPTPDGGRAVLVVCDGVSSSADSDTASLAAARAALEVLVPPLPRGLGTADSEDAAAAAVLSRAAAAANAAVIANSDPSSDNPASCTWVAAVLEGGTVRYAGLGDSRAYLLPDDGPGVQLTVDDSLAQELVDAGTPRTDAERSPTAHTIVRWLGLDAPDVRPRVGSARVEGPGWLLVCSDGLWNYASEPQALRAQVDAAGVTDPEGLALALVEWACAQGGRDNVTVALARVGSQWADSEVREDHG